VTVLDRVDLTLAAELGVLARQGVRMRLREDGKLAVHAPARWIDDSTRAWLANHRERVVALAFLWEPDP
jgi:hypothetical protein